LINSYIVDFYCHEASLAIELDGDSHIGRADYDLARADRISANGIQILRIANDDVLNELDNVLTAILIACRVNPDQTPPR
jgi:adenine-specific DNA-methyltransferase